MSTIDAHVHLYPPELNRDPAGWAAAQGERQWAEMSVRRRRSGRPVQGFPSLDELLRAMDAAGVVRAVLLGWYWNQPETCAWQNRFYAECVRRHPDRLSAFATLHRGVGVETALSELRRAREEGLIGLGELSPHSQGWAIDDPRLREVLNVASGLKFPVNLHVTDPHGRNYPGRVETPLDDFVRLAQEHIETTFIFAHWGGLLPLADSRALGLPNVYYDTAASPLLYDASIWRRMIDAVGRERVLFGSDFPLLLYPGFADQPGFERLLAEAKSALSADEAVAVLGGNARRVLGV